MRKLHNPDTLIRTVQYRILNRILNLVEVPSYIFGFERNKSIPLMAQHHVGKEIVISLDIKDFFPSIKQFMVSTMFSELGIDETSSRILSELCTYKSYVPQGSLTAPKISNIIAGGTFGVEIERYCLDEKLTLTIYADDITVSYNNKKGTTVEESKARALEIIKTMTSIVEKYGFVVNREKTKIMRNHSRQWVCGTVVNSKVNMRRTERKLLRALVHNVKINGVESEAQKAGMNPESFIRKYAGRINWLCQLNMDYGAAIKFSFRKAVAPYLRDKLNVEIPELAWNSSIEIPYVETAEDKMIFNDTQVSVDTSVEHPSPF